MQYTFRKIPSILLLLIVIIISLFFSLWILPTTSEGLTTTIQTPSIEDLNTLTNILDGKTSTAAVTYQVSTKMKQIIMMRDVAIQYTALNDIYNTNTSSYYTALTEAIQAPIQTNSEGKFIDENTMPMKNREIANAIISSDRSVYNKLRKLLELTGDDIIMKNISDKYESSWINLIRDYVLYMKDRSSAVIKKYTACSQFTNCTTCTNGKLHASNTQCYWNSASNSCGNNATYSRSTTCPVSDNVI